MTKIDIYSGFLGAGKTTLIKKMISEAYCGEKLVLIENEFGQIGIDSGFLQDSGINITEMNSGCICCSLVGDFGKALNQVISEYAPDRIVIEPSGVGKLSDVIAAVSKVINDDVQLGFAVAVVDAGKVKIYSKNYGEFYNNQVETANAIIMSRTDMVPQQKLDAAVEMLRSLNAQATIVTTPWGELTGAQLLEAMEGKASLALAIAELEQEHEHHHHHGHHGHHHGEHEHHHGEHCCCQGEDEHHHHDEHHHEEHEHHHGEHCCCNGEHEHHHHDEHHHEEHEHHHGEHCCCNGEHEHHHHDEHHHEEHEHHHGEHCCCHDEHDHHHADEVFTSWGIETAGKFTVEQVERALEALDSGRFGVILRAKGIVAGTDGKWIHFDYVPEEKNVRTGAAAVTGKLCVIGAELMEDELSKLFGV